MYDFAHNQKEGPVRSCLVCHLSSDELCRWPHLRLKNAAMPFGFAGFLALPVVVVVVVVVDDEADDLGC